MSNQDTTIQFRNFSYKLIPILIITSFSSVFFLIFIIDILNLRYWIFNFNLWLFLGIYFQMMIWFIFLFSLGNIKKVADDYFNTELLSFRTRMIALSILRIIAFFLLLNTIYIITQIPPNPGRSYIAAGLGAGICMVIGLILLFIAAILETVVWNKLRDGLSIILPTNSAKLGAILCMVGAIIDIIVPLWFILLSISGIFRIIGYILLMFYLLNLTEDNIAPPPPRPPPRAFPHTSPYISQQPAISTHFISYCPNCGSSLRGTEKYCVYCGIGL